MTPPIDFTDGVLPLLHEDSPGILLTGAPGSGKSTALDNLMRAIVRLMTVLSAEELPGLLYIDPHGTGARKFYRWCLDQGKSIARRVLYLQFSDTTKIPCINALHVPRAAVGSMEWYAGLTVITELVGKILLAAWGETDFNSKPILFKTVFRILYTLAYTGLALADAELFFNLADPLYRDLVQIVPDDLARTEMEELPELRPADRMAQIESGKNRFLGLLSNPRVKTAFGRGGTDGALNFQQLYDDRLIVIVNLETGGVLRTMDQEIMANLLLTMATYTIINTPEHLRHLQFVALDELPVFAKSAGTADLLTYVNLPQCRKFLIRTIACCQGATLFPDRTEDRLLQAFMAMAKTQFFFRHQGELDCSFFGRHIALSGYSPLQVKYEHRQPMQFQEGHEAVTLVDTAETTGTSDAAAHSESTTANHTSTWNQGENRAVGEHFRQAVLAARNEVRSRQAGRGGSEGTARQNGSTNTHTENRATTVTRKTQLVPIINTREVVTSVQFFSKEELDAMGATTLANLRTGSAILLTAGHPPVEVTFPLPGDPFAWTPKFAAKKEAEHRAQLEQRPEFTTAEAIKEERDQLLKALVRYLQANPMQPPAAGLLQHARALPVPGPHEPAILALPGDHPVRPVLRPTNDPVDTPLDI